MVMVFVMMKRIGCTDPNACNYDPEATQNDGSCWEPEEGYDCDGQCLVDADGVGCDMYEIAGCTDQRTLDITLTLLMMTVLV